MARYKSYIVLYCIYVLCFAILNSTSGFDFDLYVISGSHCASACQIL